MARIKVNRKRRAMRGKHRRRTIKTEEILVDTDESRRIDRASVALAEVFVERIEAVKGQVQPQSTKRRERALTGIAAGTAPATARRYRKGSPMSASKSDLLNDSGQLARSIVAKKTKRGKHPIKAKIAKRALYLGPLFRALDLKTAKDHPKVVAALEQGLRDSFKKGQLK